jgi:hypothetical protein
MKNERINTASFFPTYSPEHAASITVAVYTLCGYLFAAPLLGRFTRNRDAANVYTTLFSRYNNEIKTLQLPK